MRSMFVENEVLKPNARTLRDLRDAAGRLPVETASLLYAQIQRRTEAALIRSAGEREEISDPGALAEWNRKCRRRFTACIGGIPRPLEEGRAQITGVLHRSFFSVEKLVLETSPGSFLTANVYIPENGAACHPAVLVCIGHTDDGKADPEYQYLAQCLVRQGILAFLMDPPGEGDRSELADAATGFQPMFGCSGEHDLLDWKAKLTGWSLASYFIRDGLAAVRYLARRPDVDAKRIGITGHSGGGTQTALLMMEAGEQFACAAPCAYITDMRAMLEEGVDPDNEMVWPGSVEAGLDYVDFLAQMAGKPLMLLTCQEDYFPREGTERTFRQAERLWQAAGTGILPEMKTAVSGHAYAPSLAEEAARFFQKIFSAQPYVGTRPGVSGGNLPMRGKDFCPLTRGELSCTGKPLIRAVPGMRTIRMEIRDDLMRIRAEAEEKLPEDPDQRKKNLESLILASRIRAHIPARVYAEGICAQMGYRCLLWRPEEGLWNNGLLLRDWRQGDRPMPSVIALWPEGILRIDEHSCWVHRQLRSGKQVLIADLSGWGTMRPARIGSAEMDTGWGTYYKLNAWLIGLGDSICGMRIRQTLAAVRMLQQSGLAEEGGISLAAWGEASRYAEYASLLSGVPAVTDGEYQTYEEILSETFHDQTSTFDWALPGILRCLSEEGHRRRPAAFEEQEGLPGPKESGFRA